MALSAVQPTHVILLCIFIYVVVTDPECTIYIIYIHEFADVPLRVIGKVSGKINDHEFTDRDLQCYVQTKDGRTYTALARIPVNIGDRFQLLNPMSGVIGWLFAKTSGETKNGYQLTGKMRL